MAPKMERVPMGTLELEDETVKFTVMKDRIIVTFPGGKITQRFRFLYDFGALFGNVLKFTRNPVMKWKGTGELWLWWQRLPTQHAQPTRGEILTPVYPSSASFKLPKAHGE